ncbi:MAG: sigma-70 family RNA polymerase sigma factor [Candidatus Omnitrophota bacterium]
MDTQELFKKCAEKDPAAWNEFIRRYQGLVTRAVKYKLREMDTRVYKNDTKDIVQEIFLLIWENGELQRLKDSVCLRSWLAILSVNFTLNYYNRSMFRLHRSMVSLDEPLFREQAQTTLGDFIPSPTVNTERMLRANELDAALEKEISTFRPHHQLMLKLDIYDGQKQRDIAAIMNVPVGTVSGFLGRAKKRLKTRLQKELYPPDKNRKWGQKRKNKKK